LPADASAMTQRATYSVATRIERNRQRLCGTLTSGHGKAAKGSYARKV